MLDSLRTIVPSRMVHDCTSQSAEPRVRSVAQSRRAISKPANAAGSEMDQERQLGIVAMIQCLSAATAMAAWSHATTSAADARGIETQAVVCAVQMRSPSVATIAALQARPRVPQTTRARKEDVPDSYLTSVQAMGSSLSRRREHAVPS